MFPIDEDVMTFDQTPSSSALWSLETQGPSEPLIADPVPLTEADFWNVSPNPFGDNSTQQPTWTRETPVLDRFRIGNPSPSQYIENQFNMERQYADLDASHIEAAEAHNQDAEFSFLAYEEIASELDRILENGPDCDYPQMDTRSNPKQDAQIQTDQQIQSAIRVNGDETDPRESVCGGCCKPFYNVAVDAAGCYIKRTQFKDETVRERELRTKAFFCGIETAVQMFSSPVLSQPVCCPGAIMQMGASAAVPQSQTSGRHSYHTRDSELHLVKN